jgi:hypothetical protein
MEFELFDRRYSCVDSSSFNARFRDRKRRRRLTATKLPGVFPARPDRNLRGLPNLSWPLVRPIWSRQAAGELQVLRDMR